MGYYSRVRGAITFSPGISTDEVRAHPVLRKFEWSAKEYPDLELVTSTGDVLDTIECTTTESFKAYCIESNLLEMVNNLPGRIFSGRLEIYGEENSILGLRVKDGKVEPIEPKLVWPES